MHVPPQLPRQVLDTARIWDGERRYYAPWYPVVLATAEGRRALKMFAGLLAMGLGHRRIRLQPGQLLVVDNGRWLHRRDRPTEGNTRFLWRFWLPRSWIPLARLFCGRAAEEGGRHCSPAPIPSTRCLFSTASCAFSARAVLAVVRQVNLHPDFLQGPVRDDFHRSDKCGSHLHKQADAPSGRLTGSVLSQGRAAAPFPLQDRLQRCFHRPYPASPPASRQRRCLSSPGLAAAPPHACLDRLPAPDAFPGDRPAQTPGASSTTGVLRPG